MYIMCAEPMRAIIELHNISYHSYTAGTQIIHCNNNEQSIQVAIRQLKHCISDVC